MKTRIGDRVGEAVALCLLAQLTFLSVAYADEIHDERIQFIETFSPECDALDGKQVGVKNLDNEKSLEIWLERWVMGLPTGEHKKYLLLPAKDPIELGCSMTQQGDQHWKITGIEVK